MEFGGPKMILKRIGVAEGGLEMLNRRGRFQAPGNDNLAPPVSGNLRLIFGLV